MRRTIPILALAGLLTSGGCVPLNRWHLEDYTDELSFPAADAAAAQKDERRIIAFMPTLGFRQVEHTAGEGPQTEAVFIRDEKDTCHVTVTVRSLLRVDQRGFVTKAHVHSYNVGEEDSMAAGKSVLNEIDQLYRKGG